MLFQLHAPPISPSPTRSRYYRSACVTSCIHPYIIASFPSQPPTSIKSKSPLTGHARPLTPPHPLVLCLDPHLHGFCVGRCTACNAHHLARSRAAQVSHHGWEDRVHIRHWGRHTQTTFYRRLLCHGDRVYPHPRGGTMAKA